MKHLYLVLLLIVAACSVKAQQTIYLKADGQATTIRDSALRIKTITPPEAGSSWYTFKEVFITGELYRTGKTTKPNFNLYDGDCTEYTLDGKKLSYTTYDKSQETSRTIYYPNGNISSVKQYQVTHPDPAKPNVAHIDELIITCNSADGKPLVTDGNGNFKGYQLPVNTKINPPSQDEPIFMSFNENDAEEGPVKNNHRDGTWKGKSDLFGITYTEAFEDGKFKSGTSVDKDGKKYDYTEQMKPAEFQNGIQHFYTFLGHTVRYPAISRENNVQGKAIITFVVEKDGELTRLQLLRTPDKYIGDETMRAMALSPAWQPCLLRGVPVRQQYTIPISYTLSSK